MGIKSLIIDDDPFILNLLQDKLAAHFPGIEVMATAESGRVGLEIIRRYQPDLIFLDVEMIDMTGFEMLTHLDNISFQTIFITSFSHYAIKAIRFNALDYLVKPIDLEELKQAIKRYRSNVRRNKQPNNVRQALVNFKTKDVREQTLYLRTQKGEITLVLKNIVRIEGERNYSYIYLINHKKILASKNLGDLEELLVDKGFFRCHKSHLINFVYIKSFSSKFAVILSDDTEIPIARRKKEDFQVWHNQHLAGGAIQGS